MSYTGQIAPDGRRYADGDPATPTVTPTPAGKMVTHGSFDAVTADLGDLDGLLVRIALDAVVTATDATVTSATAAFSSADVGAEISGVGIPANATIASVTNATTIELSAVATASGTGVDITITRNLADVVADHTTRIEVLEP
ncbi:MAG: hypothetical protein KA758_03445 [Acidimicrobiales bacterium]|jgi:hypothetical protein|nr:hypothetical protein [Acidimicrobiales bacterium]